MIRRLGITLAMGLLAVVVVSLTGLKMSNLGPWSSSAPRQQALSSVASTDNGGKLIAQGYKKITPVGDPHLLDFLDKHAHGGIATPQGTYVVLSKGQPPEAQPGDTITQPDLIFAPASGLVVAVTQNYTNGRGMTCYNGPGLTYTGLIGQWNSIAWAEWGRPLQNPVHVGRGGTKPPLPPEFRGGVDCYLQIP